jgi:hypothetical protein
VLHQAGHQLVLEVTGLMQRPGGRLMVLDFGTPTSKML